MPDLVRFTKLQHFLDVAVRITRPPGPAFFIGRPTMTDQEVIERAIKRKKKNVIPKKDLLSSGSTLINLAATGRTIGCFAKGHYYWFVGDSTSGKTWLALSCFAEACINEEFDDYRLIYDNAEDGALMDMERYFGRRVVERLEPPRGTKEEPEYSALTEDVYFNIDDAVNEGSPFIYVLDSMDSLDTKQDAEKFKEMKAIRRGTSKKKETGSMGMAKAKVNSAFVRRIVRGCRDTKSIVIIISQTRESPGKYGDSRVAAGGRALKFFATLEMWTSVKTKVKRKLRGKDRKIGILSRVEMRKNRITGKDRTVVLPIYDEIGIDETGSLVDYLIEEKHWTGSKMGTTVTAPEFDFKGEKEDLIKQIEEQEEESKLRSIVSGVWHEIETALKVERKARYSS